MPNEHPHLPDPSPRENNLPAREGEAPAEPISGGADILVGREHSCPPTPSSPEGSLSSGGTPTTAVAEPPPPHTPPHHPPRTLRGVLKEIVLRIHSLGVLALVLYAGYLAVTYLLWAVFVPMPVPDRLLEWQGRSDIAALRTPHTPGMSDPADRAPLAHYHRVERWIQPDPRNGCTLSGCHDPLPHTKAMKIPAFANFHATFVACQLCHVTGQSSDTITWVSIADARKQEPPALLRLMRHLETNQDQIKNEPFAAHQTIITLLRGALAVIEKEPVLQYLLLELETSEPGSPVWRRAVERLIAELPSHARGEYGAKLASEPTPGAYRGHSDQLANLAQQYLTLPPGDSQRKALHEKIHQPLAKQPLTCLSCHGDTPATLNFDALGYSPTRAQYLSRLQLANLMQQIRQGKQFFIPNLLGSGDAK